MNTTRLITAILGLCLGAAAIAQETADDTGIPPQPLNKALEQFADQSGLQIIYVAELAEGKDTPGAKPNLSDTETLDQLLASTGLQYEFLNDNTVTVQAAADDAGGDSDSGNGRTAGATPKPVMMAQAAVEQSQRSQRIATDSGNDERKRPLEEIIVTGTNIRGIAPESSPVYVYDREDIQISGAATAQDFIQTLPQNFGGGYNADLPSGTPNTLNTNLSSLGSSVNLRGLGSGSTLVLLNGRRLAPSSGLGNFTDISMIPASAIERVEILSDGASSVYGSDAVAGVVNFILRDDFEGVETSLRYGIGTQHSSPEEFRAGVTGGLNWESGHALLSYEYLNQDEISAGDRAFSQSAPLPNSLQPSQKRHSFLGSASQELAPNLEVFADATYSRREGRQAFTTLVADERFVTEPISKNMTISVGGMWKPADSWFVDFSGTYGEVRTHTTRLEQQTNDFLERTIDSKLWIADVKTSGTALQLPGGDLKVALGGQFRTEDFTNIQLVGPAAPRMASRDVYAFFGEAHIPFIGPDNAVPGIERFEVNVSGRYDDYSDFGSTANPKVGVLWSPFEALRLRGSYNTSFSPPPLGLVGAADFTAIAYNMGFINPILGFTPADPSIADVILLSPFGTAKDLGAETSKALTAGLGFDHQWDRHAVAFSVTWFDFDYENRLGQTPIPENRSHFDTPNIAFNNPDAFPEGTVIFFPTVDQVTDLINQAEMVLGPNPPVRGDPLDAQIITLVRVTRNLGLTLVNGWDFDLSYTYDSDIGDLILGVDGTYLSEYKQQAAITTPSVEQVSTLYNPVDLKMRGRVSYAGDGFSANLFVNYLNDYRADNTPDGARLDSWTTVDLSFSYDTQNRMTNSILNDTVFRLSIINLFDQDPPSGPFNRTHLLLGYDPTNASPLGRFVAFELTKRFGRN